MHGPCFDYTPYSCSFESWHTKLRRIKSPVYTLQLSVPGQTSAPQTAHQRLAAVPEEVVCGPPRGCLWQGDQLAHASCPCRQAVLASFATPGEVEVTSLATPDNFGADNHDHAGHPVPSMSPWGLLVHPHTRVPAHCMLASSASLVPWTTIVSLSLGWAQKCIFLTNLALQSHSTQPELFGVAKNAC
jgi:hypothetical protein